MALIGSAYVEIRALDTNLQRDIDNAMKKIKDVTLNLQADVNLAPVRKKIEELRKEVAAEPLKFAVEVEDQKIVDSLAEAHQLYEDNPLNIISTTDTSQIQTALQTVREQFREMPSTVTANANTVRAEAQIAALTRRRSVSIFPNLKMAPDFQRALKGITYTIVGAIPADKVRASLTSILANFETLTIGAAKLLTVVGSLGAMALTTGANLLTFGADVGKTVGLLAAMPAIVTALGLGMVALKLGFKDFGGAFSSDAKKAAEAMAKLPAEAQEAVKAMRGLGAEIRKDSQGAFWKEMGTAMQDAVKVIFPSFKAGMAGISTSMAKFTKGALSSFKELAESGGMDTLLTNITKGLDAASNAVKPFFDAMNTISLTGSKHLERYGLNLTSVAERFDAWATRTSQSGEMDTWITQAGANMHNLGRIIGETVNVFSGLSQAAAAAGGKGLADVAEGMKNVAGVVNSEPFKSKLIRVLVGARDGVRALGDGFDSIKRVIGEGTVTLAGFLHVAGQAGGAVMGNIAAMFDGTGLGSGMIIALNGFKDALNIAKPAFSDFGTILGDLGEIAAVLFVNMAPGLVNLADTLQKSVDALKKGVMDVIPVFNVFIQNILMVLAPIVIGVATAIGVLLEGFAALPQIVQNAILALALFLVALKLLQRPMMDTRTGIRNLNSPIQNLQDRVRGFRDSITGKWNTSSSIGAVKQSLSVLPGTAAAAAGAVGKSFSQMQWAGAHSATAIGDGFKKTFSQLGGQVGGQLQRLGTPLKEFGSMMGKVMGEALWPRDVRDGFKQVGQKLGDVARIYTGYFTAAKDKIVGIGKSLASVFPASLLGPALKALPGEVGKTLAFAGQKVAEGVSNVAKTLAGPAVGFAMGKMTEGIKTQSLYASKHLENIGKGLGTAVNAIKAAPAVVSAAVNNMATAAKSAFGSIQQSVSKAFNTAVLAASVHPMTAPFVRMADAAKTAAATATAHVATMAKSIGPAINNATIPARAALSGLAVAASIHSGIIGDKFKTAAGVIGGNLSTAFKNAGRDLSTVATNMSSTMGKVFTGISTGAVTAAGAVTSTMRNAGSALSSNFAPAIAAVRGSFDALAPSLRPAAGAMADFGRSAGTALANVGSAAKAGIRGAATGLMEVLGGGWGVAIAGATIALTLYAQEAGKSKARVDELARTLDQTTGAMTEMSKVAATKLLFDGVTDDWDDFVRGFVQGSRTVEEMLDNLGISTKHYSDTMADPEGRDKLIKGMKDTSVALLYAQDISQEMADSLGLNKDYLNDLSWDESKKLGADLDHAAKKAEGMAKELAKAEAQIKLVAEATGLNTGQAVIMAKNYDILAKSTSTVSDKFGALKENMSLLSTDSEKHQLGQKGYQQSLRDTATKIKDIAEANDGLLLPSLYTVAEGFSFASQAGADLHSALEGQVQGIQLLGSEAIHKALGEGKKGAAVQQAALDAMQPAIDAMKKNLTDMHFSPEQIQGILNLFNINPEDIKVAVSLEGAEKVKKDLALVKIATDIFTNGDGGTASYVATLNVLPAEAKKAIEDATGIANGFADGKYEAMLKVLDSTAGGRASAVAHILTVADGKYDAELKALNLTGPELEAAKKAAEGFAGTTYSSKMDSDNAAYDAKVKAAEEKGMVFGTKTFTSKMASDVAPFEAERLAAEAKGLAFGGTTFTSKMASDNAAFDAADRAAHAKGGIFGGTTFRSALDADKGKFDGSVQAAQGKGDIFGGKTFKSALDVTDNASNKINNVNNKKLDDKSFNIFAFVDDGVRNLARGLGIQLANGGILNGAGAQTFANGGITLPTVNSYAGGGFENHVAQISRGQTPVRIWSEPETGGEAYLPLGKSKRKRSLQILDEVAEMFGYNLSKKLEFANGGIIKSMPSRSPSVSRSDFSPRTTVAALQTASSPTVITNVYPSAGLNEMQVADSVSENIYWKLSTQI